MEIIPQVETKKTNLFAQTFSTLRHRDFFLFWMALAISLLGVSFQTIAQGWLVYRLTGSATMLGITAFLPVLFAAPASIVGGILADRFSRQKLVIVTQSLMVLPPVALALLIWAGSVQVWHIIAATTILGVVAAVDLPSRTSMVPDLVPAAELLNAQGLCSAVGQLTRIIGPVLAGLVIAWQGEALPYLLNGLTYLAMVGALLLMRPLPAQTRDRAKGARSGLLGGIRYTLKTPLILGLFLIAAAQGVFLSSYLILLPVIAKDILGVGAAGLGSLTGAVGIGALVGALGVANLKKGRRGVLLNVISYLMPVVLVSFAWVKGYPLALPLLFILGLGTVIIRTITATFFLSFTPDDLRGRVISLSTLVYYGAPYLGGLPAGYLAERFQTPAVLTLAAVLFLSAIALVNLFVPAIRKQE